MNPDSHLLVEMLQVTKHYPLFTLNRVDLNLPQGEIMGLIGPNGAGKSTILKLLMGFTLADSGSIRVLNQAIPQHAAEIKQHTAYVSEEMRLYGQQTIAWHMQLMAKCFTSWDQHYAQHILQRFELSGEKKIEHLSLGQRIKTNLLLALARRPQLLVLDEPSTGLDPIARHELTSSLFELILNEKNSVIFSSQFTQDVERLSDTITFIDNGELISSQDKESYLDQWRYLELTIPANSTLPADIHLLNQTGAYASAIDTQFHAARIMQLQQAKITVQQVRNLSLEEIFIQQILLRRHQH